MKRQKEWKNEDKKYCTDWKWYVVMTVTVTVTVVNRYDQLIMWIKWRKIEKSKE